MREKSKRDKTTKKIQYDNSAKSKKVKYALKNKKKKDRSATNDQKSIFIVSLDPYEKPLKWWENNHIKYAINYKPVKLRMQALMGSQVVRLTDQKYMMLLQENIRKDHRDKQLVRIEEKKEWVKSKFGIYTSDGTSKYL